MKITSNRNHVITANYELINTFLIYMAVYFFFIKLTEYLPVIRNMRNTGNWYFIVVATLGVEYNVALF